MGEPHPGQPQPGHRSSTDVLIVGGGPVGASLAIELAWRGVRSVVVEQRDVSQPERGNIRARGVSLRSMEHLRRWGIADRLRREVTVPPEWPSQMIVKTSLVGEEILRFDRDASVDWREVAPEPGLGIPQYRFSAGLHERAVELGVTLLTGWRCSRLADTGTEVRAELVELATGQSRVIEARYAVGCDGPHSLVRETAGITRTESVPLGKNLSVSLWFPDAFEQLGIEPNANFTIFDGRLVTLFCPYQADEWGYAIGPVPMDFDFSELDLVRETTARIGREAHFELLWSSSYPVQQRVADTYRAGRLFIAGDAAHLFPPYLGQNMNTGIDDAVNLGWKLAAVLAGWGGPELLDSYSAERQPIGWRNSGASVEISQVLARGQALLNREGLPSGDTDEAGRGRLALGRRLYDVCYPEWNTSGVVLDQRYQSSVIVDDGSVAPVYDGGRYQPFAKPGHRAPHVVLAGGTPLLDALGPGLTLLDLNGGDLSGPGPSDGDLGGEQPGRATEPLAKAAADVGVPLEILTVGDPVVRDLYGARLVLVRPDQHVAWRGEALPTDAGALVDRVRGGR